MKYFLFFLAFIFLIAQPGLDKDYVDQRTRSKHFDGKQFHNPQRNSLTFWSFLKMRISESYPDWPKWIESQFGKINPKTVSGNEVHLTLINHSTVLIQIAGLNILTDPIYSDRCSPLSWIGPKRVRSPGIRFEDIPKIDVVLISHDHYDHLDLPTIEKLIARDNPKFFMGLGVGERLPTISQFIELDWWESHVFDENLKINFVPVQHFSGRGLFDRNSTLWGGFVIESAGKKIYFGGDTGYADHFKQTQERFGPMDIAFLPIGAFEPRDFMAYAHINPTEAVQAHLDLKAKTSLAIHYGTFQLSKEEIDEPIIQLREALSVKNLDPSQFLTPNFGEVVKVRIENK